MTSYLCDLSSVACDVDSETPTAHHNIPSSHFIWPNGLYLYQIWLLICNYLTQLRGSITVCILETVWTFLCFITFHSWNPLFYPTTYALEFLQDIPYLEAESPTLPNNFKSKDNLLDIYLPPNWKASTNGQAQLHPVVFYVHGGGFRILSKDTMYSMGMHFCRRGYIVFSINYRMAPKHPFPNAIKDVAAAYLWVINNLSKYGGDPNRIIFAGDSAGGNLIMGLTIMLCYERIEDFTKPLFASNILPAAVFPACPILEVSNVDRLVNRRRIKGKSLPFWIYDYMRIIKESYLPDDKSIQQAAAEGMESIYDFANPILFFESSRCLNPSRPLPAFCLAVGTKDPILDDTRRLARALRQLQVKHIENYYEGEQHAFHAVPWKYNTMIFWDDAFTFIEEHMGSKNVLKMPPSMVCSVRKVLTPRFLHKIFV